MAHETQAPNEPEQNQLDIVAKEFEEWRSQKKYKKDKIPLKLLREAQKLTEHFEEKAVRQRLGITKGQLNRTDPDKEENKNNNSDFIQLNTTNSVHNCEHPDLSIDIHSANGIKISLSGFAHKDPLQLIAKLIQG